MIVDHETLVFLDASALVAAVRSPCGGAGFIISLCRRRLLRAAVSLAVLAEAERNVLEKLGESTIDAYRVLVTTIDAQVVPEPPITEQLRYRDIAGTKDEHVVAAAVASGAPFLITLDKPLIRRVDAARLPTRALSPGEFITTVLPRHSNADILRTE